LTHDVSLLFFSQAGDRRDLHSFPTRRSSDLLLKSIPDLDAEEELYSIPGSPPDLLHPPEGDAFAIRNEFALAIDYKTQPPMFKVSDSHSAATWLLHPKAPDLSTVIQVKERERVAVGKKRKSSVSHPSPIIQVKELHKHFHL